MRSLSPASPLTPRNPCRMFVCVSELALPEATVSMSGLSDAAVSMSGQPDATVSVS